MRAWEAAMVAGGCVFAMLRRPDEPLDRIRWAGVTEGLAHPSRAGARRWLVGLVAPLAVMAAAGGGARLLLGVVAGLLIAATSRRLVGFSVARRIRRERQRKVVAVCDALSAELRGGLPMATAVRRSCRPDPELAPVVAAAELGGDIAEALRVCARLPGAEGLRAVGAAWDVGGGSGTALAGVLDRIARGLRDDDDARAEVLAALGPPRATARMLAVLPLFGLALGVSIDAHPVEFLVGTTWGLACLFGGTGLAVVGVWWVERLATAAEV